MLQWCVTEAIEGGFREIAVVVGTDQPLLEAYVAEGRWRESILPVVAAAAAGVEVGVVRQSQPLGVVDAVLAAPWSADGAPFAVFLPDNVRVAGAPPLTASHLAEAAAGGRVLAACHRVGPEARAAFGNVGRAELESLVPAGQRARVVSLQERGTGAFRAPPEGAWRLAPRYTVTAPWLVAARAVASAATLAGIEADDVAVHHRLVADRALFAVPWEGTLVDAGHPVGYLYAQHLLHEALAVGQDTEERGGAGEHGLTRIEL